MWSVYFFIQANSVNDLSKFAIRMNSLEYVGNTTHSVKGQFQESWELGELIF